MEQVKHSGDKGTRIAESHEKDEVHDIEAPDNIVSHPCNYMPLVNLLDESVNANNKKGKKDKKGNVPFNACILNFRRQISNKFLVGFHHEYY
jgi:hypothetical protein